MIRPRQSAEPPEPATITAAAAHWAQRLGLVVLRLILAGVFAYGAVELWLPIRALPALPPDRSILILVLTLGGLALLTWTRYNLAAAGVGLGLAALAAWLLVPDSRELATGWVGQLSQKLTWDFQYLIGQTDGIAIQLVALVELATALAALAAYLLIGRFAQPWLALITLVALTVLAGVAGQEQPTPWLLVCLALALTLLARSHPGQIRLDKGRRRSGLGQRQPGLGRRQSGLGQRQPGLGQRQPGLGRRQSGLGRRQPGLGQRRQTGPLLLTGLSILPITAIILAASLLLQVLPARLFFHEQLAGWMLDIKEWVTGQAPSSEQGPDFDIRFGGYYPLVERLGGPVSLDRRPVFAISGADQALLLRGSVSEVYDGWRWYRQPMDYIWRFDSLLSTDTQRTVFNLDRPNLTGTGLTAGDWLTDITYIIEPQRPITVILLAGRPRAVGSLLAPGSAQAASQSLGLYYNIAGALYSPNNETRTMPYQIQTRLVDPQRASFSRQLPVLVESQTAEGLDPAERTAYLQLPDLATYQDGGELAALVSQLLPAGQPDWDQVQRFVQYLRQRCSYNLHVSIPPPETEFVTWFLASREGYCVYFATALTMLCRLAGIPARYVEGYAAPAATGTSDRRIVTGDRAHAWTEIWIDAVGWIPVDATPGIGARAETVSLITIPTITPRPTLSPTPEPTAVPPSPTPVPGTVERRLARAAGSLGLIMLAGALILAVLIRRRYRRWQRSHILASLTESLGSDLAAARFYWRQLMVLGQLLGQPIQPEQTVRSYLNRIAQDQHLLPVRDVTLAAVIAVLESALFGDVPPGPAGLAILAECYDQAESVVRRQLPAWRYWFERLFASGRPDLV